MKRNSVLLLIGCILQVSRLNGAETADKELSLLGTRLAESIKARGLKKVTVLDFLDLQNRGTELGKYIAEELTVNLVTASRDFAVLDRANLKTILAEHKLTAKGLIDPENAKKIGMFAGVDALVLGTVIPKKNTITLTARIITTETAEIAGASRGEFQMDETVRELLAATTHEREDAWTDSPNSSGKSSYVKKSVGDLQVIFTSLQVLNREGYLLTFSLTNQSPRKSIWVALSSREEGIVLRDQEGITFEASGLEAPGFKRSTYYDGSYVMTEMKPRSSIDSSLKFFTTHGKGATSGQCNLQLELVLADKYSPRGKEDEFTNHNIMVKLDAK